MGQIDSRFESQQSAQDIADDTMVRVLTFATEEEASRCERTLIGESLKKQKYETQIKSVQKIALPREGMWKIVLTLQYPQKSLKQTLIERKKSRHYFSIQEAFCIMELTSQFVLLYYGCLCEHTDVYAHFFKSGGSLKICNPKLLYGLCKRRECKKIITKQTIVRQILEILLLEKIYVIDAWRILSRVRENYNSDLLENLISKLVRPQVTLQQILSEYSEMKDEITISSYSDPKNNIFEVKCQQPPKTPSFTTSFIVFPSNQVTPVQALAKNSSLDMYKQEISESMIKQDSNKNLNEPSDTFQLDKFEKYSHFKSQAYQNSSRSPEIKIQSSSQQGSGFGRNEKSQLYYPYSQTPDKKSEKTPHSKQEYSSIQIYQVNLNEEEGRFQGFLKDGEKYGRGKYFYHDGTYYDGFWRHNKKNGEGSIFYPTKLSYRGSWKDDQFDGQGQITNSHLTPIYGKYDYKDLSGVFDQNVWEKYKGSFREDCIDGEGTLVLSNKEKFVGYFRQGKAEGRGQYTNIDGKVITGIWNEGILQTEFKELTDSSFSQQ